MTNEISPEMEAALDQVVLLTLPHIGTLAVKRSQTLYKDDYGNEKTDKWYQEVDYFIDNVLVINELIRNFLYPENFLTGQESSDAELRKMALLGLQECRRAVRLVVNHRVNLAVEETIGVAGAASGVDSFDAIGFEQHCAEILRSSGWEVRLTKATGDQGIDIIASRGNLRGVFQCKKYAQPVGNSAVQEIISGRIFEKADFAAVVTNNSYTASARQLAGAADVHLLHFSELATFAHKVLGFDELSSGNSDSLVSEPIISNGSKESPWMPLYMEAHKCKNGLEGYEQNNFEAMRLYM